jgi:hypothetical protein
MSGDTGCAVPIMTKTPITPPWLPLMTLAEERPTEDNRAGNLESTAFAVIDARLMIVKGSGEGRSMPVTWWSRCSSCGNVGRPGATGG